MAAIKADLDTLSELYRTLKNNVETANTIQTQVDGSVNSAVWESTNATEFREQWSTSFKPALKSLEDALATARRRDEQIARSAAGARPAGEADPYRKPRDAEEPRG